MVNIKVVDGELAHVSINELDVSNWFSGFEIVNEDEGIGLYLKLKKCGGLQIEFLDKKGSQKPPIDHVPLLYELRHERGWTQEEAAAKVNMTAQGYGNIERGSKFPRERTVQNLANAFFVSSDYMLQVIKKTYQSNDMYQNEYRRSGHRVH